MADALSHERTGLSVEVLVGKVKGNVVPVLN
jgi:hypothetical protein